jgi:hypothetical protein
VDFRSDSLIFCVCRNRPLGSGPHGQGEYGPIRFADASFLLAAPRLFGEHGAFWVLQLLL